MFLYLLTFVSVYGGSNVMDGLSIPPDHKTQNKYALACVLSHLSSIQFSHSVMSDSLWPHGMQHTRLPCPSPTPRACSNMSIKSVIPSSHLIFCRSLLLPSSIFPSIRVFSSQFFASCGQSIGVPTSASVLPMNIQDWFHLRWTGWITLQSKGLSRVFSNTTVHKHQFFCTQHSHIHTWLYNMNVV